MFIKQWMLILKFPSLERFWEKEKKTGNGNLYSYETYSLCKLSLIWIIDYVDKMPLFKRCIQCILAYCAVVCTKLVPNYIWCITLLIYIFHFLSKCYVIWLVLFKLLFCIIDLQCVEMMFLQLADFTSV
jgi:hypothetical protein